MDEDEIKCAMEAYPNFIGVFARDEIPKGVTGPAGLIVNTDNRSNPGSHWVAIHVDRDGRGDLFDSLASQDVLTSFKNWMEQNSSTFLFPLIPIQSSISKLCGVYCIAFLALRFENWSFSNIINSFTRNPLKNDLFLFNILKHIKGTDEACNDHSTPDDVTE